MEAKIKPEPQAEGEDYDKLQAFCDLFLSGVAEFRAKDAEVQQITQNLIKRGI